MGCHWWRLGELSHTNWARVRFLATVNANMSGKIGCLRERFAANVASGRWENLKYWSNWILCLPVRFFARMSSHVSFQCWRTSIGFTTNQTQIDFVVEARVIHLVRAYLFMWVGWIVTEGIIHTVRTLSEVASIANGFVLVVVAGIEVGSLWLDWAMAHVDGLLGYGDVLPQLSCPLVLRLRIDGGPIVAHHVVAARRDGHVHRQIDTHGRVHRVESSSMTGTTIVMDHGEWGRCTIVVRIVGKMCKLLRWCFLQRERVPVCSSHDFPRVTRAQGFIGQSQVSRLAWWRWLRSTRRGRKVIGTMASHTRDHHCLARAICVPKGMMVGRGCLVWHLCHRHRCG